jgi:cytochrome c-type biogenesis protein CcmH/NrfG
MSKTPLHPKLALAAELNGAGRLEEAAAALEEGLKEQPERPKAWWLLGGIYWQLGEYTRSIGPSRRAAELRPANEQYSLGLFQSLLDAGRAEEVIAEVRRFLEEVERGAKCSPHTLAMYRRYDRVGIRAVRDLKRYKNS